MKKFTFGMVGLVALIVLGGQAKAYDQEIVSPKCERLFDKAEKLKKESIRTFKKFEACQAEVKVLQPCDNSNPIFKKCEE